MEESMTVHKLPFQGASMSPILRDIDFVWVDFSKAQAPYVGDVLVYQSSNKELICHRLIGVQQTNLCLKGDNSSCSETIDVNSSWGRVIAFEKKGIRHELSNHVLLRIYCWAQMIAQRVTSMTVRRAAGRLGRVYLRIIQFAL